MNRRMRRTGLLAVLLMPCFGQVAGTVADSDTYGMSNGRLWNQLPKGGKLVYLTGLRDSVVWTLQEKNYPARNTEEKCNKSGRIGLRSANTSWS